MCGPPESLWVPEAMLHACCPNGVCLHAHEHECPNECSELHGGGRLRHLPLWNCDRAAVLMAADISLVRTPSSTVYPPDLNSLVHGERNHASHHVEGR